MEIEKGGLDQLPIGETRERRLGDFRIDHEIARGGMGIVYQAQQISLGREVALKVLPFASMIDARALERFRNEVRAAASLEHPHIVSVYSVGEERGVHFYAMQLIRGQSMAAVIGELQKLRHADVQLSGSSISEVMARSGEMAGSSFKTTTGEEEVSVEHEENGQTHQETRALNDEPTIKEPSRSSPNKNYYSNVARLGIQASQALAHAHEHGIIHRDIKPGNLMLDADCQLYITDFGLARIEAAGVTMTGDWLGTPRYMSPEQALGKQVVVDHRADIYSLGVTLYELLTLRPAFDATDRQALLRQIANEEPAKPRLVDSRIPRELETIVLKAISKDRDDRYDTAAELAVDLQRFLDDKPILARPPTMVQRAAKWSTRHKPLVAVAVFLLFLATAGLSISNLLIAQQRDIAKQEREDAQNERNEALRQEKRADENFRRAQEAVDQYLTKVSENELLDAPAMQPLRKELLELALEYYQGFVKESRDDPELKAELAMAYSRLGRINEAIGTLSDAAKYHRDELRIWQQLATDYPEDDSVQCEIAVCFLDLGWILHNQVGSRDEAFQLFREAVETSSTIVTRSPDDPEYLCVMSRAQGALGLAKRDASQFGEATIVFDQAIKNWGKLATNWPDRPDYRNGLAVAYNNRASIDYRSKRWLAAADWFGRGRLVAKKLVEDYPNSIEYQWKLAFMTGNQGKSLRHIAARKVEGRQLLEDSVRMYTSLAEENPEVVAYQIGLASTLNALSLGLDDPADRIVSLESCIDVYQRLLELDPTVEMHQLGIAYAMNNQAISKRRIGLDDDARNLYLDVINRVQPVVDKNSENFVVRRNLAAFFLALASLEYDHGEVEECQKLADAARQQLEKVPSEHRNGLYWSKLGCAYWSLGRLQEARQALEKAIELYADDAPTFRDSARWWYLAMVLHELGEQELARSYYDQLIDELQNSENEEDYISELFELRRVEKILGISSKN